MIVIDIETNGLPPGLPEILQIGAVHINGELEIDDEFGGNIRQDDPGYVHDENAQAVHGLTRDRVTSDGTCIEHVLVDFFAWIADHREPGLVTTVVAGQSIRLFDWPVIKAWAMRYGLTPPRVCLHDLKVDVIDYLLSETIHDHETATGREPGPLDLLALRRNVPCSLDAIARMSGITPRPADEPHNALDDAILTARCLIEWEARA